MALAVPVVVLYSAMDVWEGVFGPNACATLSILVARLQLVMFILGAVELPMKVEAIVANNSSKGQGLIEVNKIFSSCVCDRSRPIPAPSATWYGIQLSIYAVM